MSNKTPLEIKIDAFNQLKDNIVDRIEALFMFSTLNKDIQGSDINFTESGIIIKSLVLFEYNESTLNGSINLKPIIGLKNVEFSEIVFKNGQELIELSKEYFEAKKLIIDNSLNSLSNNSLNDSEQIIMNDLIMFIKANTLENRLEGMEFRTGNLSIFFKSCGTSRQHTITIAISTRDSTTPANEYVINKNTMYEELAFFVRQYISN